MYIIPIAIGIGWDWIKAWSRRQSHTASGEKSMNRRDLMLAALAGAGNSASFSPVQVQKLLFLIDQEIPRWVAGPHFAFRPYDYGPFDSDVYSELEALQRQGLVAIQQGYYRSYSLTADGYERGASILAGAAPQAKDFIVRAANWVRALTFNQLVSAIYEKYPQMKENSVFK